MKFATIEFNSAIAVAAVDTESRKVHVLKGVAGRSNLTMQSLIEEYESIKGHLTFGDEVFDFSEVRFLAPISSPRRNIICVGKNYLEHAHEFTRSGFDSSASKAADAIPKAPIIFTKMPETVVATETPVLYPEGVSEQLDYEAELAVIIGKGGRGISKKDAMNHVFGYAIVNDVTARDLQASHKQWFLGKSLDTFCPMGPWIGTADEIDGTNLAVNCWVNGELRQSANTRDLIFDIPTLISTISAGLTLLPGDIIATGTPAGVGIGYTPPKFLQRGDRMDIEIDGLGRLSNVIA